MRLTPYQSRALARLRQTTGDPLLVRAGSGLVPTPRALELRAQVGPLVDQVQAVLRPLDALDLQRLDRTFTLRTGEGFVETFGARLIARVESQAPGVRLRFVAKPDKDSTPLRGGAVDLETGVVGQKMGPEIRTQGLFRDGFIGVVRRDHPLSSARISVAAYVAGRHIAISRRGIDRGPVGEALEPLGLQRTIVTMVSGFGAALALARASDLIATVPARSTTGLRDGLHSFALPFPVPHITVSLLWHPRMEEDPSHRWLRSCVREVCAEESVAPPAL